MIESQQNEKIKHLIRLISDNRFRKKSGVFVVEGKQENQRALDFDYQNQEYFICEEIYDEPFPEGKINLVSKKIYEKIAYRGTSEGILGVYQTKKLNLEDFKPKENSTVIIIEGAEKPGNLGAILRSCEAFGVDALLVTNAKVDFYNPNVIRSSVGCFFGMNVFECTNEATLQFLQQNDYTILTTFMEKKAKNMMEMDLKTKSALLFGTEHTGLSDFWQEKGKNITIPMVGTIDSLNLSNAVAIACYESLRQKMK